jgi:predicted SprT family Zn-dependent metalloprotease
MRIVTADFAGAAYPPGTEVSFMTKTDGTLHGAVQGLLPRRARVATQQGTLWKVPYSLLTVIEPTQEPAMLLTEVATLGKHLIREHEDNSGLKAGWQFAFDLAPARGGSCRYSDQQITLSVTYCLKASKEEIVDTILHEIAHAIVGPKHGHDATWKAAARQIGCTAERCHRIQHTPPRWHGQCGCAQQWERQRLSQRIRKSRCGKCKGNIEWKRVGVNY